MKVGGFGLEAKFDKMAVAAAMARSTPRTWTHQLMLDAYRTAVTAELTAEHLPKANAPKWLALAQDMRKKCTIPGYGDKGKRRQG